MQCINRHTGTYVKNLKKLCKEKQEILQFPLSPLHPPPVQTHRLTPRLQPCVMGDWLIQKDAARAKHLQSCGEQLWTLYGVWGLGARLLSHRANDRLGTQRAVLKLDVKTIPVLPSKLSAVCGNNQVIHADVWPPRSCWLSRLLLLQQLRAHRRCLFIQRYVKVYNRERIRWPPPQQELFVHESVSDVRSESQHSGSHLQL